jgi:hypothetical protein
VLLDAGGADGFQFGQADTGFDGARDPPERNPDDPPGLAHAVELGLVLQSYRG